jgi:hypothetical protein
MLAARPNAAMPSILCRGQIGAETRWRDEARWDSNLGDFDHNITPHNAEPTKGRSRHSLLFVRPQLRRAAAYHLSGAKTNDLPFLFQPGRHCTRIQGACIAHAIGR